MSEILRFLKDGTAYDHKVVLRDALSPPADPGTQEISLVLAEQPALRVNRGSATAGQGGTIADIETQAGTFEVRQVALHFQQAGTYGVELVLVDDDIEYSVLKKTVADAAPRDFYFREITEIGADAKLLVRITGATQGAVVKYRIVEAPVL